MFIGEMPPQRRRQRGAQGRQDEQHANAPERRIRRQVGEDARHEQRNAQRGERREVVAEQNTGDQSALHGASSRKFAAL